MSRSTSACRPTGARCQLRLPDGRRHPDRGRGRTLVPERPAPVIGPHVRGRSQPRRRWRPAVQGGVRRSRRRRHPRRSPSKVPPEGVPTPPRDGAASPASTRFRRRFARRYGCRDAGAGCDRGSGWGQAEASLSADPTRVRFSAEPDDPAFVTALGDRIPEDTFETYLQELRGVRINMEFNGAICRGLLSTRYKEAKLEDGQEPDAGRLHSRQRATARRRINDGVNHWCQAPTPSQKK